MDNQNQPPVVQPAPVQPTQETPTQETPTASVSPPIKKSGAKKLLATLFILLVLVGGGLLVWQHFFAKTSQTVTSIKDIPVLRVGSLNGPIGSSSIYPNPQTTYLPLTIDSQIFEGLVGYRSNKIVPLLATSWTNPDNSTWVFKIAKNVKFQNGSVMTVADVVSSLNANLKDNNWNTYLSTVSSIKATGPDQVTITTTKPDSLLLNRLIYGFVFQKDATGTYYGTGPYTVDKTKPDSPSATTLKAFDGYHGGSPKTKAISYSTYDADADMIAAFKAHKIDNFDDYKNTQTQASLGSSAHVSSYIDFGAFGLNLNIVKPNGVMANKLVREAVAYAIDRPALAKQTTNATESTQSIVPQSIIGYSKSAVFPSLDVTKSKQLQTQAGYPGGVPLTFAYVKDAQPDPPVLIKQLIAAGFKMTADPAASSDEFFAHIKTGNEDLFGLTVDSNYYDASDLFAQILDSTQSTFHLYNNPQYDALVATAAQEFNPAQHIQKVQAINQFVVDNYLWIPVHSTGISIYSVPQYQISEHYSNSIQTTAYWQVGQVVTTTTDRK
jgi:peptide/nickel transport system substrate-binding protein